MAVAAKCYFCLHLLNCLLVGQLEDEIVGVLDLVERILTRFGFTKFEVMLSTRPDKSVGNIAGYCLL